MLSFLVWMVTDFENATAEVQRDRQTENWSRFSVALHIFLPVAGLAIFLKQKHIFSRLLLQLDRSCVSVFCPSLSRRENLLKWAGSRLPETWSSQSKTLSGGVSDLWHDGSLLCTLINSVVPGACLNPHRHWRKPPLHAQALAYKYLDVVPAFTESDLSGDLTVNLESAFLHYLSELQQAIIKLSERNELNKITSIQYVARGMGLYTGEQHRKTIFYVYPHESAKIRNNSNIIIHIRGPYGTYGEAVIPKFHHNLFNTPDVKVTSDLLRTKKLLQRNVLKPENSFIKSFSLPFMQYHKKHMGDNIVIHVAMEDDRAKVTYIPKNYGMYEVIMVSHGELIRGCPFNVHILSNTSGIEETLEREEKEEEIPHIRKRKIISKTIDFINEQMPVADLQKRYKDKKQNHDNKKEDLKVNQTATKINEMVDKEGINKEPEVPKFEVLTDEPAKKNKSTTSYFRETGIEEEEEEEDKCYAQPQTLIYDVVDTSNDNSVSMEEHVDVLEKQNIESVNENLKIKLQTSNKHKEVSERDLNENKQTECIIPKVNDYIDKTKAVNNDVLTDIGLMPTESALDNDDRKLIHVQSNGDLASNNSKTRLTINEYPRPIVVNKVQIPEKFSEVQNLPRTDFVKSLHTKYLKNAINSSNKREIPIELPLQSTQFEENKCIPNIAKDVRLLQETNSPVNEINVDVIDGNVRGSEEREIKQNVLKALSRKNSVADVQKINSVPRRFFQINSHPSSPTEDQCPTSTICADHIVPEVSHEFEQMSLAEKRKMFVKQASITFSNSSNSSFSEAENAELSNSHGHCQPIEGLSVMNFLSSLKQSDNSRKPTIHSLSSTKSLPNISSVEDDFIYQNSVKERKNFWENLSTSSSSLTINSEVSSKRKSRKLTEDERSRLIWSKPNEKTISNSNINLGEEKFDLEKTSDLCKSADDILSVTNCVSCQSSKKYKSLDDSLNDCTMLSIEERKKMLLKQNYQKETVEREKLSTLKRENSIKMSRDFNKEKKSEERSRETNDDRSDSEAVVFTPILEKIKIYDNACNISKNRKVEETIASDNKNTSAKNDTKNDIHSEVQSLPQPQKIIKSHFKKAIKYFKNLEEKSLRKSKPKPSINRRYSLDGQTRKNKDNKKGGSLNLPNVSQRFSLSNLYADISGDRRGSFKGAANRSALVEALATFSEKQDDSFKEDTEDNIKYDLFKKKTKSKTRRSIKSIFDVYY